MSSQPSTYVPADTTKIADWQRAWGDYLVIHTQSMGRLHQAIAEDYAAYEGRLDNRSFQYITEQYGLRTPAKLVSYPLLNRMVNFLVNKTQGDSIDVGVECIDETIISEKQDKIARAAAEMLLRPLRRQMEQEIKTKIPDDMVNAPVPADPEEFMQIDWKSEQEVGIQWAMRYMSLTYNLDQLFQEGMKDMAICYKQRKVANQIERMTVIGEVKGKDVVLLDDLVDTAGTLTKAADMMTDLGARSVRAMCTHAILSGDACDRLERSSLVELVVADTIPIDPAKLARTTKVKQLSVAPLFARVIQSERAHESISSHFIFA